MRITDRDAAAKERPRAVLNVLHLLELSDEIGPNEPSVAVVWLREAQFFQVPEPVHLCRACGGTGLFVCWVGGPWDRSPGQTAVQRRHAVGGKLDLLLMLDV